METNTSAACSNAVKNNKIKNKIFAMGEFQSIDEFTKKGLSEIIEATKCANAFPQGASRDLYCAYSTFGRVIDEQSNRILGLISHVLKWQNVKGNIQCRQPDEQFEMLLECNDVMFERLQSNLDELAGIKKNPQTIVVESRLNSISPIATPGKGAGSWNLRKNEGSPTVAARLITAKNIARPQVKFQIPIDNSADTPFVPKIKNKPNSLKPLAILPEYDETGNIISYLHPYEYELLKFEVPNVLLKQRHPEKPKDASQTQLMYVDTNAKLKQALDELKEATELAIDVEHHSYRTFLGFTCLVQISTRSKDYIFDALELREEMQMLNEVFTNSKIVKIFHGADMDVEWLQRDLSLYIVNMFDTHQAAKALNFARLSLAYLMKHYCDIEIDKTFQLADWRIRPLPEELIAYARQDTHFLIYIYERLTNDLLEASNHHPNLLRSVYQRSNEICKKRYNKPIMTGDSHMDLYRKSKRIFDNRQLFAFREIFIWRDTIARLEDESYGYVLPNHMMLQISESLPREMQGILACCNPIPPLVRQHLHALHQIILKAREQPLVKPILEAEAIHRVAYANVKDYNSKLHCPHDLSYHEEFRDDLPTLISFGKEKEPKINNVKQMGNVKLMKPILSVFTTNENSEEEEQTIRHKLEKKIILPYQRYIAVLPMVEKEKQEEAARIEAENKKRQLCPEAPTLMPVEKDGIDVKNIKKEDIYSMPIKEMLKRKYEESVAKKSGQQTTIAKRFKTEDGSSICTTINIPDDKLKFVDLPPTQREFKQQNQNNRPAMRDNSTTVIADGDNDHNNSADEPPEEKPTSSQPIEKLQSNHHQLQKRKLKNKKGKFSNSSKAHQSSDKPVHTNFDYKKVDFNKFQGGAQKAKSAELKPQFHGKGNTSKAQNKKFNKLFTFSNVKANKK